MLQHSFHECSLRSSSLIIIHKQSQTIVTATDKVFHYLGYNDPHQLLGKPIRTLNLRHFQGSKYLLQCYDYSDKLFQLCAHQDPNAGQLEYWLLKPLHASLEEAHHSLSILRLSSYGTVEYAHLAHDFPQTLHELHGHPIMSYIHPSDVLTVCEKLKQCRMYDTFPVRWLNKHPRHHQHDDDKEDFVWISFTVIHANYYRKSKEYDPQTRPLCILRPLDSSTTKTPISDFALSLILTYLRDTFIAFLESFHFVLDQGKTYMVDYSIFVMSSMMTFISQAFTAISDQDIRSSLLPHIYVVKDLANDYLWSTSTMTKKQ